MARPKSNKQQARLTVTLDERSYEEVCQIAVNNDVSAAWVIRKAVQQYLGHLPPQATPTDRAEPARGQR